MPAKIAPFIQARIENNNDIVFNLIHCKNCGSAFFDYRYDEAEIKKIYKGYRNQEYQSLREHFESWYSKKINYLIGDDIKTIHSRNKNLSEILEKNLIVEKIKTVLDYGGDKGQYIPKILNNANKYVYDISMNNTVTGVTLLQSIEECKKISPTGYDFIMCAHVLEHLANPLETIQVIKDLIKKKGYLYIEVPFDSPFYANFFDNLQYIFNKHFKLKDLVKKYVEMKTSKYSYMHEHINFYTINGLNKFLKANGFNIIYSNTAKVHSVIGMSKIISVLASFDG